jgi:histidine ammonia-lyase
VCRLLRARVAGPGPDRFLAPELAAAEDLVLSGAVVEGAEAALGRGLQ